MKVVYQRFRIMVPARLRQIAAGHLGQAIEVDDVALALVADLMIENEGEGVDDVLGVDLHDLQLRQQQVGRRERLRVELKAIVELEGVTHAEPADEDIELPPIALVVEEQAAIAMQVVEAAIGHVPELGQEPLEPAVLAFLDHDVDIAVPSVQRRRTRAVPVEPDGGSTQQPHQDLRLACLVEQASRFGFDVGKGRLVLDHGCAFFYHAGVPRVSR